MSEEANTLQVGGDHYRRGGAFQHWDLVEEHGLGYLEGCATKYVTRWRGKNGRQDLEKARHYVVKLAEMARLRGRRPRGHVPDDVLARYAAAYGLTDVETEIVGLLGGLWTPDGLTRARKLIEHLMKGTT